MWVKSTYTTRVTQRDYERKDVLEKHAYAEHQQTGMLEFYSRTLDLSGQKFFSEL